MFSKVKQTKIKIQLNSPISVFRSSFLTVVCGSELSSADLSSVSRDLSAVVSSLIAKIAESVFSAVVATAVVS